MFSIVYSQIKPYEEPIFFNKNIIKTEIENVFHNNNRYDIVVNKNINHYLIKLPEKALYQFTIDIKESLDDFKIYFIDQDKNSFSGPYKNEDIINNKNPDTIIPIPFEGLIYDPFGVVFYLRELDLELNQEYTFKTYSKTTLRDFSIKIIDIQNNNVNSKMELNLTLINH